MQGSADIFDQAREVMASIFGVDESDLPDNVTQDTCDRWDSLYHMTLLLALEDHFGTTFSMDEMPEMTSLPKIVSVLEQRGAG